MRRIPAAWLALLAALAASAPGARAAERPEKPEKAEKAERPKDLAAEVRALREEIERLRAEIARLAAASQGPEELTGQLVAIARRLEAGEKLAADGPEMDALLRALRSAGGGAWRGMGARGLAERAAGLVRRLPAAQRARLHARVLLDVSQDHMTREGSLRELVSFGDEAARKVVLEALELERLLPPAANAWSSGGYLTLRLARAGIDMKEKAAVDAAVAYYRSLAASAAEHVRARRGGHGFRIWGADNARLLRDLAAWSNEAGLLAYAQGGRGGHELKTPEEAAAFGGEVERVAAWWKGAREKFEFPEKPEPEPVEPAPQPAPKPPAPAPARGEPELF